MANYNGNPFGFSGLYASNPPAARQYTPAQPMPQDLNNAIGIVTIDHLANSNLDVGSLGMIRQLLHGRELAQGNSLLSWFYDVYHQRSDYVDTRLARHNALTFHTELWLPNTDPVIGLIDEHQRLTLQNPHYRAQSFLRRLIEELGPDQVDLARAFVNSLGLTPPPPPPPTTPPALYPPLPYLPPDPFQPPSPLQTSAPLPEPRRSIYCPGCGNHFKAFNNLNRHWFEEHKRSNRSSKELRSQFNQGALGPFTPAEAKARNIDKESVAESEADRSKRRAKKKEAKKWRHGMQKDPEHWETVAQLEDGYDLVMSGMASDQRKKRAQTKKRAESKKDKEDDENDEAKK